MTTQAYRPKIEGVEWVGPEDYAYAAGGLIHCVLLPAGATFGDPLPAAVMVHGWGGNESVMWIFKQTLPDGVAIITPRAPVEVETGRFVWFDRAGQLHQPDPATHRSAINKLAGFIERLPELYPVDPARLLLIGFSQGAAISNNLVMTRPKVARGLASLAGFTPDLPDSLPPVDSLQNFPVFITHGRQDETVPVSAARHTRQVYERLGATVTYSEHEVGHKLNSPGLAALKTWVSEALGSRGAEGPGSGGAGVTR